MNSPDTFIQEVARKAGEWLKRRIGEEHTVDYKGIINIVTEADRQSEEMIVSAIL